VTRLRFKVAGSSLEVWTAASGRQAISRDRARIVGSVAIGLRALSGGRRGRRTFVELQF
jgi:hypothetical protein